MLQTKCDAGKCLGYTAWVTKAAVGALHKQNIFDGSESSCCAYLRYLMHVVLNLIHMHLTRQHAQSYTGLRAIKQQMPVKYQKHDV